MEYYDDYYEEYYSQTVMQEYLDKYISWCNDNGLEPEATRLEDMSTPGMVAHVAYHAREF